MLPLLVSVHRVVYVVNSVADVNDADEEVDVVIGEASDEEVDPALPVIEIVVFAVEDTTDVELSDELVDGVLVVRAVVVFAATEPDAIGAECVCVSITVVPFNVSVHTVV